MRLSIDCRMWRSSGIGTYLRNLVPHLITLLPNFKIYLLGHINDLQQINDENDNVDIVECNSPIYSISEQYEMLRKMPKCDMFFSPHYNIPLLFRGIQITTIHDLFHIADENYNKTLIMKIYARGMLSAALRKSRIVFTDSNFTLSEMIKYKLPGVEKVRVINIGASFANIEKPLENNDKYIVYVGNIKPHKNLKRLITAYKILHEKYNIKLPLMIVGEADSFITGIPGFREEIADSAWSKWITFTGKVSDEKLISIYQKASILVLPSLYEGFGLPPLEAMACGCPCVVSNVASLPEVCGEAALYCDPYDVQDIARKIYELIVNDDLRETLIAKGFKQVETYKWENTATFIVKALEEVIDC